MILLLKIIAIGILMIVGTISLSKPMLLRSSVAVQILTAEQYKRNTRIIGVVLIALAIAGLFKIL